jgi:hypothetical protein
VDVENQIELARTFLRQAVRHQSGLSSSANRALAAIRGRDLGGALAIVRGMYRLVGGGAAKSFAYFKTLLHVLSLPVAGRDFRLGVASAPSRLIGLEAHWHTSSPAESGAFSCRAS